MTKFFLFLINILFLISFASAVKLGASPSAIEFNGYNNEKICEKVVLFSFNETIIVEDKWSLNNELVKDFREYNNKAEDLEIKIEYIKEIRVENKKGIEVCLTAKNHGNYYGILNFRTKNKPAGIGIWMSVKIEDNPNLKINFKLIENLIKNINLNNMKIALSINSMTWLFVLIFLIVLKKRK